MISRYALEPHGWIIGVCFAAFGVTSASLFVALLPAASSFVGRIGLAFLMVAAIGFVTAGAFPMDAVARRRKPCDFRRPTFALGPNERNARRAMSAVLKFSVSCTGGFRRI